MQDFLYREATKLKIGDATLTYGGLIPKLQKSILAKDRASMQPHIREFVDRAVTFTTCPECEGARTSKIKQISIADACTMEIRDLADWVRALDEPSVTPPLTVLQQTLDSPSSRSASATSPSTAPSAPSPAAKPSASR